MFIFCAGGPKKRKIVTSNLIIKKSSYASVCLSVCGGGGVRLRNRLQSRDGSPSVVVVVFACSKPTTVRGQGVFTSTTRINSGYREFLDL